MARIVRVLPVVGLALVAGCVDAQRGVLVMAHGGEPEWNQAVEEVVAPLRRKYPTEIAFGMADSSTMRAAVQRLECRGVREIAVVRMFISADSFLPETEYILGVRPERPAVMLAAHAEHALHAHPMDPPTPIQTKASLVISRQGVAESPLIDAILVERVHALSTNPAEESVLLLAHGPGDDAENSRWLANMQRRVKRLRELGPFREVRCETLREDWPEKRAAAEQRIRQYVEEGSQRGRRVIVVPFRVAGFGPYAEVLQGLNYVADGRGFCPHPNMTRWLERAARECFETPGR